MTRGSLLKLLFGLVIAFQGVQPSQANNYPFPRPSAPQQVDSVSQLCGRNALFLLLRASGRDTRLDQVSRITPVGVRGTSLTQLQTSAEALGFPCDMIRTEFDQLKRMSQAFPSIVLMRGGGIVPAGPSGYESGHYMLLVNYSPSDGTVQLREGSYGRPAIYSEARFREKWSGYALVPRPALLEASWFWTGAHAAFWLLLLGLLTRAQ